MPESNFSEIDLSGVKKNSIKDRKSKVNVENFCKKIKKDAKFKDFLNSLPDVLYGKDFKEFVDLSVEAVKNKKMFIVMLGAHVIKVGVSPLLIDMINSGVIKTLTLNGAGVIHDVEVALFGKTSEDVAENLNDGTFGMTKETADFINGALLKYKDTNLGFGEIIGRELTEVMAEYIDKSLFAAAYLNKIPATVHSAIGTEVIHQHPEADGGLIGKFTMRDFKIFTENVSRLIKGSIVINFGSAVILPEVFLKALTIVKNLGKPAFGFYTANFDMIQHYRPNENVVSRPTLKGGKGFQFAGYHELLMPLYFWALKDKI